MLRICSCFALLLVLGLPAFGAGFSGIVRITDGDSLYVGDIEVRLHGIDAVERRQRCYDTSWQPWACGDWVTRQMRDRYDGQHVTCTPTAVDGYGRTVARCLAGAEDLGQTAVRRGWAYAFRRYSDDYVADEARAADAQRGLHNFRVESPARYRLTGGSLGPEREKCTRIRGNISAGGERIYHLPHQRFYLRTRINVAKGERCFETEAQARASGWRRAMR